MRDAVRIFKFAVTSEAIEDERKTFIAFHIAGAIEELIQDSSNQVL
jgi:hypothetical protein